MLIPSDINSSSSENTWRRLSNDRLIMSKITKEVCIKVLGRVPLSAGGVFYMVVVSSKDQCHLKLIAQFCMHIPGLRYLTTWSS